MSFDSKKIKKWVGISVVAIGTTFAGLTIIGKIKKESSNYENEPEEMNPMEGKKVIFVEDENDKENTTVVWMM